MNKNLAFQFALLKSNQSYDNILKCFSIIRENNLHLFLNFEDMIKFKFLECYFTNTVESIENKNMILINSAIEIIELIETKKVERL